MGREVAGQRVRPLTGVGRGGGAQQARRGAAQGVHMGRETRPVSTGGGTRRVQLVREGGRGGGGAVSARTVCEADKLLRRALALLRLLLLHAPQPRG